MTQDPEAARALSLAHGQVCYLQLPAASSERAAAFYQAVFGWDAGTHYPDFEAPGLIGQWLEGRLPARDAGPMIWLAVADMAGTLEQVTRHGGEILEPPAPDGPDRTLATIIDPEGNPIGLAGHNVGQDTAGAAGQGTAGQGTVGQDTAGAAGQGTAGRAPPQ